MALSEHEKATLAQIALGLDHDYPKLASRLGPASLPAGSARQTTAGICGALAGCLVLLAGIAVQALLLGVIGFVMMGAGAYLATMRVGGFQFRRRGPAPSPSAGEPELW
ncbi:DUF3040 domain-containing protein [Arthrobacter sp. CJ23]|uniref:DUF3040 domain-containing protein n=1 Tax=Arthrobacter sp. CJ23 TaxID=2972479 RepID=UPI00215C18F9|nr:DUF3040 domain-containing protein [Arthrobacter sp. CJ23]UVJ41266.1 DUF3040 domain-containing protein [Arthrobacter sp. CJ23]